MLKILKFINKYYLTKNIRILWKGLFTLSLFCTFAFLFTHHCNKELSTYLDNIKVKHVLSAPNHLNSQGAFKAFKLEVHNETNLNLILNRP